MVSEAPFMKRETMGWLPIFTLFVGRMTADSAFLAVFVVVYDNPCSCRLTRKSSTVFKGGFMPPLEIRGHIVLDTSKPRLQDDVGSLA